MVEFESIDIEDKLAELQQQQLKTIWLLEDIQRQISTLSINNSVPKSSEKKEQKNKILIGDRVQILNPRRGQPTEGTVARISNYFVFIDTQSGQQVRRAIKNVRKLSHHE